MASNRSEVDQKLKTAISTRLGEMGLYVDDQLPNYIMVMITNKRSKKEMDKELQLFLGDETNRFTTWLQTITNKIEDATSAKLTLKRKSIDGDKRKKKKLKKNYSSESDSDTDKKKKIKSVNLDGKSTLKLGASGFKSDASIDENLNIGIDKYLNNRSDKAQKEISPDTTSRVVNTKTGKNEKFDNTEKRTNTTREAADDEEDFLNIREEDIYDFFNDRDDNVSNANNKAKPIIESAAKKSEKVQITTDSGTAKSSRIDKKSQQQQSAPTDIRKNFSKSNDVDNENRNNVQPYKLKSISKQDGGKYVGASNEFVNSVTAGQLFETKNSKTSISEQLLKREKGPKQTGSTNIAKSISSHRGDADKRSLLLDDDSSLDAREFINRKRGLLKTEKHSPRREDSQMNVSSGRYNMSGSAHNGKEQTSSARVDNRHRILKTDRPSSPSDRYLDGKRYENNEDSDDKYGGRRSKYEKNLNVIGEKNKTAMIGVRGKQHFIHSDNDTVRVKRFVTNRKRYNSDDESDDGTQRIRGKHILPSDTPEDGGKKKRKVDSMATLPQKVVRPKLSPTGSANTNLVRKAFEDVQRSLNNKEKVIHSKRNSRITTQGNKNETLSRAMSPTIHEIRDEKDRHVTVYNTLNSWNRRSDNASEGKFNDHKEINEEKTFYDDYVAEQHANKGEQPQSEPMQQEQLDSQEKTGIYYSSFPSDAINIYESSQKTIKPPKKPFENQSKPLKDSMVQRVLNMARNAARQKQPVEEYVPENTTPQFVVTLTGLDPNAYPTTSETISDQVMTTSKVSNNIIIDAGAAAMEKKSIHKKTERCKYWPNCLNNECSYAHPTSPCTMFPNCKFGNACLYIHPKCKFDPMCTRYDCPFTHMGSSMGSSMGYPSAPAGGSAMKSTVSFKVPTACKFYPNCTNSACPFQHPRICRFDKFCSNRNCTFSHTSRNNMLNDKLKWVNPQIQNNNASATPVTSESVSSAPSTSAAAISEAVPQSPHDDNDNVNNNDNNNNNNSGSNDSDIAIVDDTENTAELQP